MSLARVGIFENPSPFDYDRLMTDLHRICRLYPIVKMQYLGESILGRAIPCIRLGTGKKSVLYVGTHHGMEWITALILTGWIEEFAKTYTADCTVYRRSVRQIAETASISVLPMLNPDGTEYQIHGVNRENPLFDRLLKMNGESNDFSCWQANGRGVDLNHNYDAGFWEYKAIEQRMGMENGAPTRYSGEEPGSEPETAALINHIRFQNNLSAVLTLHTQGEEIYWKSGNALPAGSQRLAGQISGSTGYRLADPEGSAAYGGLIDWCVQKQNLPAFTIECGKGKNPLPQSDARGIYLRLRETLFCLPTWL